MCKTCALKLDDHHQFASMALKMQDRLYSLVNNQLMGNLGDKHWNTLNEQSSDYNEDNNCEETEDEEDSSDDEGERSETEHSGSLLHSILTYVRTCFITNNSNQKGVKLLC